MWVTGLTLVDLLEILASGDGRSCGTVEGGYGNNQSPDLWLFFNADTITFIRWIDITMLFPHTLLKHPLKKRA